MDNQYLRSLGLDDQMAGRLSLALARMNAGCGGGISPGMKPSGGGMMVPKSAGGTMDSCGLTRAELLELAKGEDYLFGLDSGAAGVNGGITVTISTPPQKRCLPHRITVGDATITNFGCSAISIGVEPVLITTGLMSLAVFRSDSVSPSFRSVPLDVGMDFSMTVTNITLTDGLRYLVTITAKALPGRF